MQMCSCDYKSRRIRLQLGVDAEGNLTSCYRDESTCEAACCLQCHVSGSELSTKLIEEYVNQAKATVDQAYIYSQRELLEQPSGSSREALRAADYMDHTLRLITSSMSKRRRRSINATDLITTEDLDVISRLTGCAAQLRLISCQTIRNLNSKNPRLGASNIPFLRWLPAEYEDQINLPKGWTSDRRVSDQILPLVREMSNRILSTANVEVDSDPLYTHLVTIFGQLTDHDLTFTPTSPSIRSFSNGIDCEKTCANTEPCIPIEFPQSDPCLNNSNEDCMPFTRSAPACGSGEIGHFFGARTVRQQLNTLSAFIDPGHVYGSDDIKARLLRDFGSDQGYLRVNEKYKDNGRDLLPFTTMGANMCAQRQRMTNDSTAEEVLCFFAGDSRSSENTGLTALHTLMIREHNRLACSLAELNPHWDGERLYQEARKIMGGYFQDYPEYPTQPLHRTMFAPWMIVFEGGVDPILRGLVGRQAKLKKQDSMMTGGCCHSQWQHLHQA